MSHNSSKPKGLYVLLLFSLLAGGFTAWILRESDYFLLRFVGYIVILLNLLLFTLKNWVRLTALAVSIVYIGFYLVYLMAGLPKIQEEDGGWIKIGLTLLLPLLLYSIALVIYLTRPKVRQYFTNRGNMNAKLMTLVFLTAFHALLAPPAQAAMSTYAECQSQPSQFGPRSAPLQCCVERHFEAVQACRAQKGCPGVGMDVCPQCLDPVFEMDNCPERA